jgi:hypothetical protein
MTANTLAGTSFAAPKAEGNVRLNFNNPYQWRNENG